MGERISQARANAPYKPSGSPREQQQTQVQHQTDRYESQQGPLAEMAAFNYGRGSEANYGDYTDIMNQYRNIASGSGASGGGGGGGYAGWGPSTIQYNDPFNSYAGYTEFSQTGGYSPQDLANMRARGISPIRAAYSNAEREMGRQRSLQGGYAPNMYAAQLKMAREQGQSAADAAQNVEAGLATARNQGRLAGLGGMSDIEKQRLAADLEVQKFNAQAQMSSAASNAGAANAANAASRDDQFRALNGMVNLYGATPGMANLFGNQAINLVGQSGNFGLGVLGASQNALAQPDAWQQGMGRFNDVLDIVNAGSTIAYPWLDPQQKKQAWGPQILDRP